MLELERIQDSGGFELLRREWNELLEASSANCVFLTWEWLFTWWKHLSGGRRLHLLVVRRGRMLVAIAPLAVRPRQPGRLLPFRALEFLGTGTVGSDYLDLIIRQGEEEESLRVLTRYLSGHKLVIEFTRVRATSVPVGRLVSALSDERWFTSQSIMGVCPYINLSQHSWDSYLVALGPAHRSNLRRRERALSKRFQVDFEQADAELQRRHCFAAFLSLHRKRWSKRDDADAMDAPGMLEFHEEFSHLALQLGWLRLFVLSLDGKPAASIYAFRYNDSFYFYQSGFDPALSRYSVGLVVMGLAIKSAIHEGAQEYDLLHGDEQYKSLWTNSSRELIRLNCYPPTAMGLFYRQAMELRLGLKKIMRWPRQLLAT